MGLLKAIKDVVLLPVDIAKDVTGITLIQKVITDDMSDDTPFDSIKRLKSLKENWDETFDN